MVVTNSRRSLVLTVHGQSLRHQWLSQQSSDCFREFLDNAVDKAQRERQYDVCEFLDTIRNWETNTSSSKYRPNQPPEEKVKVTVDTLRLMRKNASDDQELRQVFAEFEKQLWDCTQRVEYQGFSSFQHGILAKISRKQPDQEDEEEEEEQECDSEETKRYKKRIAMLTAKQESRIYEKMISNLCKDEKLAKERDTFAGMQQQISVASTLFFGMFCSVGAGYYSGMLLSLSEEQRWILAILFLVITLFVEMVLVVLKLSRIEE